MTFLHQTAVMTAANKLQLLVGLRTMNTFIQSTILSIVTISMAFTGCAVQAQQPQASQQIQTTQQSQTTQQYYVAPPVTPPQQQNPYYFGFSVQLVPDGYGSKTLRIVSVTPGSPAQQAGLEVGDEIRSVNGMGFLHARDSFDGVNMLSRFVSTAPIGGGPAPAAAATATATAQLYVAPPVAQPVANMIVRNVRNGQDVSVTVRPTPRYNVNPPAVASPPAAATVTH
jgi:membrane-associated protease RseP (regulator of RpoE activity)